jgi:uroporphyrinogen decarboxylase
MKYEIDMQRFWEINNKCLDFSGPVQRVPVSIDLPGDWICAFLGLDNEKYYSVFKYQQENRMRCSEITQRELGYTISPAIDFGVIMDSSIYGGQVHYESTATPTLKPVINTPEEIDDFIEKAYKIDILQAGLVPDYLSWREKLISQYGIKLSYGASIKGCATMLGQLCGITNFLMWIVLYPEQIRKLVQCWLDTSIRYIKLMREITGYTAEKQTFSLQSDVTGMMSPDLYDEFIKESEKKLYDTFAPDADAVRYYHADSHMLHHLNSLRGIGVNQVNIDPYVEPVQILEKMPDVIIHGQIPPTKVLLYGTADDVVECVRRDINQAGPGKHLIITTAGSINPGTSIENLKAICYAAEIYGYVY